MNHPISLLRLARFAGWLTLAGPLSLACDGGDSGDGGGETQSEDTGTSATSTSGPSTSTTATTQVTTADDSTSGTDPTAETSTSASSSDSGGGSGSEDTTGDATGSMGNACGMHDAGHCLNPDLTCQQFLPEDADNGEFFCVGGEWTSGEACPAADLMGCCRNEIVPAVNCYYEGYPVGPMNLQNMCEAEGGTWCASPT